MNTRVTQNALSCIVAVASTLFPGCAGGPNFSVAEIGGRQWMTSNLATSTYSNGDRIHHAKSAEDWKRCGEQEVGAWCYYGFSEDGQGEGGALYNWYAVSDPRGLAPEGWHIPSVEEWFVLVDSLDGLEDPGCKLKLALAWNVRPHNSCEGMFGALPSGLCTLEGVFEEQGLDGHWWTSSAHESMLSPKKSRFAYQIHLSDDQDEQWDDVREVGLKESGLSIRCIRD